MRDDIEILETAIEKGWKPEFESRDRMYGRTSKENTPHWPIGYSKGNVRIWKAGNPFENQLFWRAADLIDKHYCNHRTYNTVIEALETEDKNL